MYHLFPIILSFFLSLGLSFTLTLESWGTTAVVDSLDDKIAITNSVQRTWKTADGKFSRQGLLIEIDGDKVRLEAPDKKILTVPIDRLSQEDQAFIESEKIRCQTEDDPFMEDSADPFSESGVADSRSLAQIDRGFSQPGLDLEPNLNQGKLIQLNTDKGVDLQASRWQPAPKPKVTNFQIPSFSFHAKVEGSVTNPDNSQIILFLQDPFGVNLQEDPKRGGASRSSRSSRSSRGRSSNPSDVVDNFKKQMDGKIKTWIETYDLKANRSVGRFPLDLEDGELMDADPSGTYLLVHDKTEFSNPMVSIFELADNQYRVRTSWFYRGEREIGKRIEDGRFLADGHAMIRYRDRIEVWKLNPLELLSTANLANAEVKLANDRRHALITSKNVTYEIDLIEGKVVGQLGQATESQTAVVDPSGRRTAEYKFNLLTLSDSNGRELDQFCLPAASFEPRLNWLDDKTLLISGNNHQEYYVDVDRRVVFLQVNSFGFKPSRDGWSTKKNSSGNFYTITVNYIAPEAEEKIDLETYRRKLPKDADSLLILREGDRVRLRVDLKASPQFNQKALEQLAKLMKQRGVIVDDSAKDEVVAESSSEQQKVEFRKIGFGAPGGTEEATVTTITQTLSVVRNGEVVYRINSYQGGVGFMIDLQPGESVQQAVDRMAGKPESFWESLTLPQKIAKHPNAIAWTVLVKDAQGKLR